MFKIVIILFTILFILPAFGGVKENWLVKSVQTQKVNDTDYTNLCSYQYSSFDAVQKITKKNLKDGEFIPYYSFGFGYQKDKLTCVDYCQAFPYGHAIYLSYVNDNISKVVFYNRSPGLTKEIEEIYHYSYSQTGRIETAKVEVTDLFEKGSYIPKYHMSTDYDNNTGLIIRKDEESMFKGELVGSHIYQYNSRNLLIKRTYTHRYRASENNETVYTYDTQNRLISSVLSEENSKDSKFYEYDQYGNISKFSYSSNAYIHPRSVIDERTYDDKKNILVHTNITIKNGKETSKRITKSYNAGNQATEEIIETMNNGVWEKREKNNYSYSPKKLLSSQTKEVWENGVVAHKYKENWRYNDLNLLSEIHCTELKNTTWVETNSPWTYSVKRRLIVPTQNLAAISSITPAMSISYSNSDEFSNYKKLKIEYVKGNLKVIEKKPEAKLKNPKSLAFANFPNPCANATTVKYFVDSPSFVELKVINEYGRVVENDNLGFKAPNSYEYALSTTDLPNGTYFYMVKIGEKVIRRKMIVSK